MKILTEKVFFAFASLTIAAVVSGFFIPLSANALTTVTVTSPNGGEYYRGARNVTWTSTGGSPGDLVDIVYSTNNFSSQAVVGTGVLNSAGVYSWNTVGFPESGTYLVRFVSNPGALIYDTSDVVFMVDNTAPTTSQTPSFPSVGGWYNLSTGVPTISLSCNDGAGSGCNNRYYSWDSGATVTYSGAFSPAEGVHSLAYWSDDNATDQAGVRNVEATSTTTYQVDTVRPALLSAVVADTALRIGDTSLVTLTFSEAVTGFDVTDATVPSGSLSVPATSDGGITWTATLTPTNGVETTGNVVTVDETGVIDVAGNTGTGTETSNAYDVDTLRPTLAITMDDAALNIGDTATVTFTFSEIPASFDATDVSVENGALGAIAGGPLVYTATFTPTAGIEDSSNVITTGTDWTDVAGNAPAGGSSSPNYDVDTIAPTAAISYSDADALVKQGDSLTITATFSQPLLAAPIVQIAISGSNTQAAVDMTFVDSTHYTYVHTVGAGDGLATVALSVGTDPAGNVVVATPTAGASFMVDNTPPTLVITMDDTALNIGDTALVTFTWDVAVTGFDNADITVIQNGTLSPVSTSDGIVFTSTFTPAASVEDPTNVITVTKTGVLDIAGNAGVGTEDSPSYAVDTIAPTVASITTKDADEDGEVDTATIIFSEKMLDSTVTAAAFSIGGSAASSFASGTADDETIDVSHSGVAGTEVKDVLYTPGTVTDLAGNALAAVLSGTVAEVDAAKPVLMSARTTSVTTATATFSEDINGGTVNSVTFEFSVTGTIVTGAVESITPGVITLTYAPALGTGATPTVTYTEVDTLQDLASVPNTAVTPVSVVAVDGVAPLLTDVRIHSNNVKNTALAKAGDMITITATSSETIIAPTVTIAGHAATVTGSADEWYATYTMTGADSDGNVTFSIAFEDDATPTHNVGFTTSTTTDSSSVLFDKTPPSVNAGVDREVNASFTQSDATATDAGSGLDFVTWTNPDVFPTGGTVTFTTPATITAQISTNKDGVYVLRLTAEDEAGNTAYNEMQLIWDTLAPRVEFTVPADESLGVSASAGTLLAYFREMNHGSNDENILLLNAGTVYLEKTSDGSDVQIPAQINVQDGDSMSNILEVDYNALQSGTTYCLTMLAGSVRDVAGNVTTLDTNGFCFTTAIDTVPPYITLATATSTATTADIEVHTNEAAVCRISDEDKAYGDMTLFSSTGGTVHTTTLTGLAEQSIYEMYVRCQDTVTPPNTMTTSGSVQFVTDVLDVTPPPAPLITTVATTVNADTFVLVGTLAVGTPADEHQITVYAGASAAGTLNLLYGQTSWSMVVPLAQNATTTFTATATDHSGNVSPASAGVDIGEYDAIGVDTTAPDVPVITTSPATVDADTYTINGMVTDDGGTRIVRLYNGASLAGSVSVPGGQTAWNVLVALTQGVGNSFSAIAWDESGNTSASSAAVVITESPSDTTAPAVTAITVSSITTSGADLSVTTDSNATCRAALTDVAYSSMPYAMAGSGSTAHTYSFSGLSAGATYDVFVRCSDGTNVSESAHETFTTVSNDTTGPTIQGIQASSITHNSATIQWVTDENATSRVEYGTTSSYGSFSAADASADHTSHTVALSSLSGSQTYHFRVISTDATGNTTTSGDNTFETTFDDTTAVLEVTGISATQSYAAADDTFTNGWHWTFSVTVPTGEEEFAMKFSDFVSGSNTIPAAANIRYYTAQSSEADDANTEAVVIAGSNTYPATITLDADLDPNTAGRQIEVMVEMKVPVGTTGGSYSGSYGVMSDTGAI